MSNTTITFTDKEVKQYIRAISYAMAHIDEQNDTDAINIDQCRLLLNEFVNAKSSDLTELKIPIKTHQLTDGRVIEVKSCRECPHLTPWAVHLFENHYKCVKHNIRFITDGNIDSGPSDRRTIDSIHPDCSLQRIKD